LVSKGGGGETRYAYYQSKTKLFSWLFLCIAAASIWGRRHFDHLQGRKPARDAVAEKWKGSSKEGYYEARPMKTKKGYESEEKDHIELGLIENPKGGEMRGAGNSNWRKAQLGRRPRSGF